MAKTYVYMTRTHYDDIRKFEVVKRTDKTVTYIEPSQGSWSARETRANLQSSYSKFHDTWEDARAYLVKRTEREIESCRERQHKANSLLGQLKKMKPPADEVQG